MPGCPCGTGMSYEECCGPYLRGASQPPTAELLMRSRYTAYVKAQLEYLFETLHPGARKGHDPEQTRSWARESEWLGLQIVRVEAGGEDDASGTVEFIARYRPQGGDEIEHHEVGSFERFEGRWYFKDGRTLSAPPITRGTPRVGRNDPCPCGSGKKYKRCCG